MGELTALLQVRIMAGFRPNSEIIENETTFPKMIFSKKIFLIVKAVQSYISSVIYIKKYTLIPEYS